MHGGCAAPHRGRGGAGHLLLLRARPVVAGGAGGWAPPGRDAVGPAHAAASLPRQGRTRTIGDPGRCAAVGGVDRHGHGHGAAEYGGGEHGAEGAGCVPAVGGGRGHGVCSGRDREAAAGWGPMSLRKRLARLDELTGTADTTYTRMTDAELLTEAGRMAAESRTRRAGLVPLGERPMHYAGCRC